MKIKKLLAAVLVFALCAAFFAACAKNDEPTTASTASEPTTETYESVKMNIGCISGPTGIGMAYLMGQSDEKKTANEYTFSVATSPDEIVSRFANGEMNIASVPTNLAAKLYAKLNGNVKMLAINTGCVLYIAEKGDSVKTVADLKGKPSIPRVRAQTPNTFFVRFFPRTALTPIMT